MNANHKNKSAFLYMCIAGPQALSNFILSSLWAIEDILADNKLRLVFMREHNSFLIFCVYVINKGCWTREKRDIPA